MNQCENELQYIQFGIASREDILRQSVVEVSSTDTFGNNSVYDERMGPLQNTKCKTCFEDYLQCTGHFGHIVLVEPIVNPHFANRLLIYLSIFCWHCSRRVVECVPRKTKRNESFLSMLNAKSRGVACHVCKQPQPIISLNNNGLLVDRASQRIDPWHALQMLSRISTDELKYIGIDVRYARPQDYLLQLLPVLPHMNRPSLKQGAQICNDDLTAQYLEIVKNNNKAKKCERSSPQYEAHVAKIAYTIQILINNSNGTAKHPSSGRKIRGICERMTGKDGLLRNNCMGKRSDQTARAVASPGPQLTCGQIGVPESVCNVLTRAIVCTEQNQAQLQQLCDENRVPHVDRIIAGSTCEFAVAKFCNRKQTRLEPGDVIIRPQQLPIVVRSGHEIIQEGDQILRNNTIIAAQPAHFRRFEIAIGDVVSRYLDNGDVLFVNRQPTLHTGSMTAMDVVKHNGYTFQFPLSLTHRFNLDFDGDEANVHAIQSERGLEELRTLAHANTSIISPSTSKPWITLVQDTLLSLYLMSEQSRPLDCPQLIEPHELAHVARVRASLRIAHSVDTFALISSCLHTELCVNTNEMQIVCGVWISGKCTKLSIDYITRVVCFEFGKQHVIAMLNKMQHRAVVWLSQRGFTIDANDVLPLSYHHVFTQTKQMALAGESGRTIRDTIHNEALKKCKEGNIFKCIESGAKGTLMNIGQMVATVGQQQCRTGVFEPTLVNNRVLPFDSGCVTDKFEHLTHRGYIVSSFAHGLSPREFLLHCIPSRESLVNIGTGTAKSGYLQHRIVKLTDDIVYSAGQVVYKSGDPKTLSLNYNNGTCPYAPKVNESYFVMMQKLTSQ